MKCKELKAELIRKLDKQIYYNNEKISSCEICGLVNQTENLKGYNRGLICAKSLIYQI